MGTGKIEWSDKWERTVQIVSWYMHIPNHPILDREGLEGEGRLLFCEMDEQRGRGIGEDEFGKIFRASLRYHYIDLIRAHLSCRPFVSASTITVSIDFIDIGVDTDQIEVLYLEEKLRYAKRFLDRNSWKVFSQILNPSPELKRMCEEEYFRGLEKYENGQKVLPPRKEIKEVLIAKFLHISKLTLAQSKKKIRDYLLAGPEIFAT